MSEKLWKLIIDAGCIQHGESVVLKSGKTSDLCIDLRRLTQHPKSLALLLGPLVEKSKCLAKPSTCVAGVPMGGIHLATLYSHISGLPQILIRKEAKTHGTKRVVEIDASFQFTNLILVEDVITTGSSVLEIIHLLKLHAPFLKVVAVVCLVNREGLDYVGDVPVCALLDIAAFSKL